VTGREFCPAKASRLLRAARWTLVASITVSFPRRRRLSAIRRSSSNASPEALWSDSSSETAALSASDETISVLLKCFRAKVDLPLPAAPIRSTIPRWGIVNTTIAVYWFGP